jgi:phage anti-repressor protein
VSARSLRSFLEIGRDFSTWIEDRIDMLQLIQGKDYGVFAKFGENSLGGRPAKEYYLTLTVARWLATDIGTEKGREIIKKLVAAGRTYLAQQDLIERGSIYPGWKAMVQFPDGKYCFAWSRYWLACVLTSDKSGPCPVNLETADPIRLPSSAIPGGCFGPTKRVRSSAPL